MAKSRLNAKQIVAIHAELQSLVQTDGAGFSTYRKDESDEMVAKRHGVSAVNVATLRTQFFGPLRKRDPNPELDELRGQVHGLSLAWSKLDLRLRALEEWSADFKQEVAPQAEPGD